MGSPSEVVDRILSLLEARPATLGAGRLLCVDGPAGSGKTTLASAVARALPAERRTRVVHLDDLYDGWAGLPVVAAQLTTLLGPLARGRAGHYRRYDWHAGRFAETVEVAPVELLILEGVGSGLAAFAPLRTALVWVEAEDATRLARWRARDGAEVEPFVEAWCAAESAYFARERPREAADLVWSTTR